MDMEVAADARSTLRRLPARLIPASAFGLGVRLASARLKDLPDALLLGHSAQHFDDLRMKRNSAILLIALGVSHDRPGRIDPAILPVEAEGLTGPCAFNH